MGAVGTATIPFGSTPAAEGSVAVTGQTGITGTSSVEAWMMVDSTTDNDTVDHQWAGIALKLVCGNIVAGTGFTIYATSVAGLITGDLKVKWVWN